MKIKDQIKKLKDNWLIVVIVLALLLITSNGSIIPTGFNRLSQSMDIVAVSDSAGFLEQRSVISPSFGSDFSPEATERKIIKTTRMSTEVKRNSFKQNELRLKKIISSSDSYLLNENVNKYGVKRKSYYSGNYQIKVDTSKYNAVISGLKEIGEIKSFNENMNDVTGSFTNIEIELETEKARLKRYNSMYSETEEIKDKIELNDRIFNQERRVKYLEDSLKNIDQRIDFSTIYFTMTEKRSGYSNIAVVKFSELIKSIVASFNSLINLIFVIIPWIVAFFIIRFLWKKAKTKKR